MKFSGVGLEAKHFCDPYYLSADSRLFQIELIKLFDRAFQENLVLLPKLRWRLRSALIALVVSPFVGALIAGVLFHFHVTSS